MFVSQTFDKRTSFNSELSKNEIEEDIDIDAFRIISREARNRYSRKIIHLQRVHACNYYGRGQGKLWNECLEVRWGR